MSRLVQIIFAVVLLGAFAPAAQAATCYAVDSANWNVATTWSKDSGGTAGNCAGNGAVADTPGSADTVNIGEAAARAVTIPAGYAALATVIAIGNSGHSTANSLSLAAANSTLTTSGAVTVNRPGGGVTNTLNVDAGGVSVGGNVTLSGTATNDDYIARIRITTGTLDITGDLVFVTGSAANNVLDMSGGAGTVNLQGAFTATVGTLTPGTTSTFTFNGAAAQTLTGATTFNNLVMNNAAGLTINSNVTVSAVLTLTSGAIVTGANIVITTANCPGSVSRTSGHVAGFLRLQVPAGEATCVHHVGDSTTYRPISLTFPSTTTTGNLTGSVSRVGEHPNIATSDLDAAQNVNRFWTLTNGGVGLGGGSYSATFTFVAGDVDTNAAPLTFRVQRWRGTSWSARETAGTRTATTTQATGITAFSDFAVGQRRFGVFKSPLIYRRENY